MIPKKICIIGALGLKSNEQAADGQIVKTRELYQLLKQLYGDNRVTSVDTLGWSRRIPAVFGLLVRAMRSSDVVIMLPAQNGVQVFSRLLLMLKQPGTKLFYDVIGGWLPELVKNKIGLQNALKQFDGIWVETTWMSKALSHLGISNSTVVPNFKKLKVLSPDEMLISKDKPFRLCTFSRVMREKGIEDAVSVVTRINERVGQTVYTLDIYGKVAGKYEADFSRLQDDFPDYIRYMGVAPAEKSVAVLKDYFALLFPTRFYTEGIPGTIIDAYCAGVPVISSRWQNCADILDEGKTGLGYSFEDPAGLTKVLEAVLESPECLLAMKSYCLEKACEYQPDRVGKLLVKLIEEDET